MNKHWFSVTEVRPNVFALAEFEHWEKVVSYLIVDRSRAFLIDTGMGYESIRDVVTNVTSLPITVLLTHAHWDHIGSVHEFKDVWIFDQVFERQNLYEGFSSVEIEELNDPSFFTSPFTVKQFEAAGRSEFKLLKEAQKIESDSFNIEVIHTPGHTPGSVCFVIPELNIIATGDTLYPGPLYAQLPESNLIDYKKSIQKLSSLSNPGTLFLPGHNDIKSEHLLINEAVNVFAEPDSYKSEVLSLLSEL